MTTIPTTRQLDELGTDAAAYLQALIDETERAIPMCAFKADKAALADDLNALNALWREYFGGGA